MENSWYVSIYSIECRDFLYFEMFDINISQSQNKNVYESIIDELVVSLVRDDYNQGLSMHVLACMTAVASLADGGVFNIKQGNSMIPKGLIQMAMNTQEKDNIKNTGKNVDMNINVEIYYNAQVTEITKTTDDKLKGGYMYGNNDDDTSKYSVNYMNAACGINLVDYDYNYNYSYNSNRQNESKLYDIIIIGAPLENTDINFINTRYEMWMIFGRTI